MGTGQLVCLILGVLLLAVGGGMRGGRYAQERFGDPPLESLSDTAAGVGAPDAKRPSAEESGHVSTPGEFEWAVEPAPAPRTPAPRTLAPRSVPAPIAESDAATQSEAGGPRETASTPGEYPVRESTGAPEKSALVEEYSGGESLSKYVIQAMSTSSRPDARAARDTIATAGFSAGVFEAMLPGRGKWYRVYIGPYDNEKEARSELKAVRRIPGFDGSFLKAME